jgi:hypothetical protein
LNWGFAGYPAGSNAFFGNRRRYTNRIKDDESLLDDLNAGGDAISPIAFWTIEPGQIVAHAKAVGYHLRSVGYVDTTVLLIVRNGFGMQRLG